MFNILSDNASITSALSITCIVREIKRTGCIEINTYTQYPEVFKNSPHVTSSNYISNWLDHKHVGEDIIHVDTDDVDNDNDNHINISLCNDIGIQCLDMHPELYIGKNELEDCRISHGLPEDYILAIPESLELGSMMGRITTHINYPVYYINKITPVFGGIPITPYNIRDTLSIVSNARCVVTSRVDSILHIAAALNIPTVVLVKDMVTAVKYTYPSRQLVLVYGSIEKLNYQCLVSSMNNVISGTRGIVSM
jgi:hypothetical protein